MHNGFSATHSRANGLSEIVKKFVYGETVSRGCCQRRLGDVGVKLPRFIEGKGFPFPTKNTSFLSFQIQSRSSLRRAETLFRATMGSQPRRSGFGDQGKDSVPSRGFSWMDENEYPPLSASSSKAIHNSSGKGKGKGRLSAEEAHVPSKPQQLTQSGPRFTEETEKPRDFHQNRQRVDGQGAETGKLLETGDRRSGWKDDSGHRFVSGKHQQVTQGGLGFGEGTERQESLNLNRQSVDHDRREPGDREGAVTEKGPETGGRRNGWKNAQVQHTYVSSRSQQQVSRMSGSTEGTERTRSSNENRQNVHHDRDEAGDRHDAEGEKIDALGRTMARILRHQAAELNLKMSNDGYVNVQDILKLPMKTGSRRPLSSHNIDEVKQAVQQDNKQRFGIKEENGQLFIRANQGHSLEAVKTEHLLKPIVSADEIPVCVHGTYRKFLDRILEEGLKRMERNHVHFASGVLGSDGVISGMRASAQVLIYLNVEKALADGMKLYMSENKVILTEGFEGVVPPHYFKEVLSLPGMRPIAPRPRLRTNP